MPPENEDEFGVISKGRKNDWLDMPQLTRHKGKDINTNNKQIR